MGITKTNFTMEIKTLTFIFLTEILINIQNKM